MQDVRLQSDTSLAGSAADTVIPGVSILNPDSISLPAIPFNKFSSGEIDSIFRMTDRRQQQIDSSVTAVHKKINAAPGSVVKAAISREKVPYNVGTWTGPEHGPMDLMDQLKTKHYYLKVKPASVIIESKDGKEFQTIVHEKKIPDLFRRDHTVFSAGPNPGWLLFLLIGLMALLAWLKLFYNKFFDRTLQSVFNYQLSIKVLRDQNIFSKRVSVLLNLNFILILGLFLFLLLDGTGYNIFPGNSLMQYLQCCLLITSFLLARYILIRLTGIIFQVDTLLREFQHQIMISYKGLGVYMILVIIGIAYSPDPVKIYMVAGGLALFLAVYLGRIIKGFQIIFKKDISIIYLILYLCTLEILPVLVVYKFISSLL